MFQVVYWTMLCTFGTTKAYILAKHRRRHGGKASDNATEAFCLWTVADTGRGVGSEGLSASVGYDNTPILARCPRSFSVIVRIVSQNLRGSTRSWTAGPFDQQVLRGGRGPMWQPGGANPLHQVRGGQVGFTQSDCALPSTSTESGRCTRKRRALGAAKAVLVVQFS